MQRRPRRQPERAGAAKDGQADQQGPEPGEAGTTGSGHGLSSDGKGAAPCGAMRGGLLCA